MNEKLHDDYELGSMCKWLWPILWYYLCLTNLKIDIIINIFSAGGLRGGLILCTYKPWLNIFIQELLIEKTNKIHTYFDYSKPEQ